jgi:isopenicillin-N N-acyltransferase-like protein
MKPFALLVAALWFTPPLAASEPRSFPEGEHGKGELRYVDGMPVLTVRGTPAEMGEQFGKLAIAGAPDLTGLHKRFLRDSKQEENYPAIVFAARRLKRSFPAHIDAELEAAAKAAGRDLSLLLFANTLADLSSGMGCSTLVVEPDRSTTGGALFGRNFDWLPTTGITDHTLVVVYKGTGKRPFAAVTVSPIAGVISGMNDAGLAVTINEISIRKSKDGAAFNWKGTPLLMAFRRVLEECATIDEAEKLLRAMPRTTTCCLTLCDTKGGAVFEITPTNLEVRRDQNGVCCCTNHFRTDKLCVDDKCWRYAKLAPLQAKDGPKLGVKDVFTRLDEVSQGRSTLQSMVFEPDRLVLHLACGEGNAPRLKPHVIDLGKLFRDK